MHAGDKVARKEGREITREEGKCFEALIPL